MSGTEEEARWITTSVELTLRIEHTILAEALDLTRMRCAKSLLVRSGQDHDGSDSEGNKLGDANEDKTRRSEDDEGAFKSIQGFSFSSLISTCYLPAPFPLRALRLVMDFTFLQDACKRRQGEIREFDSPVRLLVPAPPLLQQAVSAALVDVTESWDPVLHQFSL
eukprot:765973-Hanusia_phi.AAC.5